MLGDRGGGLELAPTDLEPLVRPDGADMDSTKAADDPLDLPRVHMTTLAAKQTLRNLPTLAGIKPISPAEPSPA